MLTLVVTNPVEMIGEIQLNRTSNNSLYHLLSQSRNIAIQITNKPRKLMAYLKFDLIINAVCIILYIYYFRYCNITVTIY